MKIPDDLVFSINSLRDVGRPAMCVYFPKLLHPSARAGASRESRASNCYAGPSTLNENRRSGQIDLSHGLRRRGTFILLVVFESCSRLLPGFADTFTIEAIQGGSEFGIRTSRQALI